MLNSGLGLGAELLSRWSCALEFFHNRFPLNLGKARPALLGVTAVVPWRADASRMRFREVAFGGGKTTLSSPFIRHLAAEGLPVIAIDADINQHLGIGLGMSVARYRA